MENSPDSQNDPFIPILMVILMHKELKLSTIKVTTGLPLEQAVAVTQYLLHNGIIEFLNRSRDNPSFRLISEENAKRLLWDHATMRLAYE